MRTSQKADCDARQSPLVTAVIPVYNHELFVRESISSILNQTYPNLEVIIINDGSKDGSHDEIAGALEGYQNRQLQTVYVNRENRGLSATLNEALAMAKGKYFSPLASDDIALPRKIEVLVEALEKAPRSAAAFGDAAFIDENGGPMYLNAAGVATKSKAKHCYDRFIGFSTRHRDRNRAVGVFGSYAGLLFANYLPAPSSVIRTDALRMVGGWTDGNILEDWEMWLKLSKNNAFLLVDEVVALYRMHGQNTMIASELQVLQAAKTLVERERDYCAAAGLKREWDAAISHQVYCLLKSGKLGALEQLRELTSANMISFLRFLMESCGNTILRKLHSRSSRSKADSNNVSVHTHHL